MAQVEATTEGTAVSSARSTSDVVKFHNRLASGFIALGVLAFAGLLWFVNGQSGLPLRDGWYSCQDVRAVAQMAPTLMPPSLVVENGEVIAASRANGDPSTPDTSINWSDVERVSSNELRVTLPKWGEDTPADRYVCTHSSN